MAAGYNASMKPQQFSIAYLMLETFWVAVACGVSLTVPRVHGTLVMVATAGALIAWMTAIFGLLGLMKQGFFIGLLFVVTVMLASVITWGIMGY